MRLVWLGWAVAGCVGAARLWRAWNAKEHNDLLMVDVSLWKMRVAIAGSLPSVTKLVLSRFCDEKNWGTEAPRFSAVAEVTAVTGAVVVPLRGVWGPRGCRGTETTLSCFPGPHFEYSPMAVTVSDGVPWLRLGMEPSWWHLSHVLRRGGLGP